MQAAAQTNMTAGRRWNRRVWLALACVVGAAALLRGLLLASGSVSFHSDEAVVALMARHILQGERPVFFYGQAYMGSTDAWLVAAGFAAFGERVLSIRLVQSALYLAVTAVGFALAWQMTRRTVSAIVTGLLFACPPVLAALYTTATLGGYNETLLLGGIVLLMAAQIMDRHAGSLWRWRIMGLCAGIGWWANGLIVLLLAPAGLVLLVWLWRGRTGVSRLRLASCIGGAIGLFFLGSLPWWEFALRSDLAPLRFFIGSPSGAEDGFAGTDIISLPFAERVLGLFFLGVPALLGIRFPWTSTYFMPVFGLAVLAILLLACAAFARRGGRFIANPYQRALLWAIPALFAIIYLATRFSSDPTGRYFLPLVFPLFVIAGAVIGAAPGWLARAGLAAVLLGYFAWGQADAASREPGLTTQFNLQTHIPNTHDEALIAFLEANDLTQGYTTYWVSFRMAFLSGENVRYSASLPYKSDLTYTPLDERYPPYREAADSAERFAYITANVPELDALIVRMLDDAGVTAYTTERIGPFTVYYDFAGAEAPRPPFVTR
jgi:4-amino-4-deoxy-L-arabinose transferase-like glycosyltransferase